MRWRRLYNNPSLPRRLVLFHRMQSDGGAGSGGDAGGVDALAAQFDLESCTPNYDDSADDPGNAVA
jgi:hypothetical protein